MKRIALGALVVAGLLLGAEPAQACTCAVRTVAQQVETASVVFTGTARNVTPPRDGRVSASFAVAAVYKGDVGSRVRVSTAESGAACGAPMSPGSTYVVFATGSAEALETGICHGTTDDLSVVAGMQPLETFAPPGGEELPGDDAGSRSLPIGTASGVLAFVIAASIWAWMMRVRPPRPLA